MEGWARAATAVAATTTGSNADRSWDKSLSLTSPTAFRLSAPKESDENFPGCLRRKRNSILPRNCEAEHAKLDAAPPIRTVRREREAREREVGWKGERRRFVEQAMGTEAIGGGRRRRWCGGDVKTSGREKMRLWESLGDMIWLWRYVKVKVKQRKLCDCVESDYSFVIHGSVCFDRCGA